ncbi:hypothetical protein LJK87_27020 [Paenibacillus sp. P25]|nr:hypothetical protein LJK87_27020 [Paenibacillus sp. P25]
MALQLIPFLMLDGKAGEAIDFYVKSLDAKVLFRQTFGEAPMNPDSPYPRRLRTGSPIAYSKSASRMYSFPI